MWGVREAGSFIETQTQKLSFGTSIFFFPQELVLSHALLASNCSPLGANSSSFTNQETQSTLKGVHVIPSFPKILSYELVSSCLC